MSDHDRTRPAVEQLAAIAARLEAMRDPKVLYGRLAVTRHLRLIDYPLPDANVPPGRARPRTRHVARAMWRTPFASRADIEHLFEIEDVVHGLTRYKSGCGSFMGAITLDVLAKRLRQLRRDHPEDLAAIATELYPELAGEVARLQDEVDRVWEQRLREVEALRADIGELERRAWIEAGGRA